MMMKMVKLWKKILICSHYWLQVCRQPPAFLDFFTFLRSFFKRNAFSFKILCFFINFGVFHIFSQNNLIKWVRRRSREILGFYSSSANCLPSWSTLKKFKVFFQRITSNISNRHKSWTLWDILSLSPFFAENLLQKS